MSDGKGMDALTIIALTVVVLVALYAVSDDFRIKMDEVINAFLGMLNMKYSGDDKIAEESVQALACAVDITAYYSNPENKVPETGINFAQFKSCSIKGELSAPVAPAEVAHVSEIDGTPPTTTTGETAPAKKEETTLTGSKVSCGGVDYYLSASNVDLTKNSADISIDYQGGTKKTATLTPYNFCPAPKVNCFVYSGDYSEKTGALKGIKANIQSTPTKDKKVLVRTNCIAEHGETTDTALTGNLLKNIALSNAESLSTPTFSSAVIDVTKSLGDRITGWAAGETAEPNKKCFGGEERCVECEMKDKIFSCNVKAFELPQKVVTGDSSFSTVKDYAKTWMGFVGEPFYVVYFETFPPEAGNAWTYDSYDIAWTVVATGAIMNVGGGAINAGYAGLKMGTKELIVAINAQGVRTAFKEGAGKAAASAAFKERIFLEYGGKKALQSILSAKAASAVLGNAEIRQISDRHFKNAILREIQNGEDTKILKQLFNNRENMQALDIKKLGDLDAIHSLISGTEKITTKDIDEIIKTSQNKDIVAILTANKEGAVTELNMLQKKRMSGDLLSTTEREALKGETKEFIEEAAIKKQIGEDIVEYGALESYVSKAVNDAYKPDGKYARLQKLLGSSALDADKKNMLNNNVDEVTEMAYHDIERTYDGLDPDLRNSFIDRQTNAWKKIYRSSDSPARKVMDGVKEGSGRAAKILETVTVGSGDFNKISKEKKLLIMSVALAGATIGMTQNTLEKYETTCGAGSLCLHMPSTLTRAGFKDQTIGGGLNNKQFKVNVESQDGLVMLKLPQMSISDAVGVDSTMRLALASPCKTDLVVMGGTCMCMNYHAAGDPAVAKEGVIVNEKPHAITAKKEIISNCEKSLGVSFSGVKKNCIVVDADLESMKNYAKTEKGFENNYCFENTKKISNYASLGIDVVSLGATIAAIGLSGGMAIPVMAAIGGGAVVAGQTVEIKYDRWPNSQYE